MNYIVFDLEWNQSPGGKRWSNSQLPFEIIEIGAVKLNEKKKNCGQFSAADQAKSIQLDPQQHP